MAYFLNVPIKKNSFTEIVNYNYFVDKSKLISDINKCMNIPDKYICITRPRRFGKTINAMMIASYYSKNADFKYLFDNLEVSKSESYLNHLNKHNVIYMTLNELPKTNCSYQEFIDRYTYLLIEDLKSLNPNIEINSKLSLSDIFMKYYNETGESFVFILDEWDYIFNNNMFTLKDREQFLEFLKMLLKDKAYVELVYMTGVLPIAKYSSGSAINMFLEFNIMNDKKYDSYFGFTENEVENLCKKQDKISADELREWYNGYNTHSGLKIYNPRSVAIALNQGVCQSYWTNTGPMDEIFYYIQNNIEAVRNDIVKMVSNINVNILLEGYGAEKITLNTREEILSAMVVYGFLSYYDETLSIPNKELRMKFDYVLKNHKMGEISNLVLKSNEMLEATIKKDTKTMEKIIQETHDLNIPIIKYGDENSLSCVVSLAYLNARSKYKIIREMPSGIGFADFVFFPNDKSKIAFIVELKKNSTPEEAIKQIKEKRYADALKDYIGPKLAVGISYDSKLKNHSVKIEDLV